MHAADIVWPPRYRVVKTLGQGGAGCVFLADDVDLGRRVAIKVPFLPSETAGEDWVRRLVEEARVLASLRHPNVVSLFDLGRLEGGRPFVVFEYVEGTDLASEIARARRLHPDRAAEVVMGLLAGLAHAHERGVIHRDVKPPNILIRAEDGVPQLADFGCARATSRTSFRTQTGLVIGTPDYLAPELLLDEPLTASADIYAAGCVLFECLVGRTPFSSESPAHVFRMHLEEPPPPADSGRPALDAVVRRALAKKPAERYAGAAEMRDALELAMRDTARGARTQAIVSDAHPRGARPRTALVSKPERGRPRTAPGATRVSRIFGPRVPARAAAAAALAAAVVVAALIAWVRPPAPRVVGASRSPVATAPAVPPAPAPPRSARELAGPLRRLDVVRMVRAAAHAPFRIDVGTPQLFNNLLLEKELYPLHQRLRKLEMSGRRRGEYSARVRKMLRDHTLTRLVVDEPAACARALADADEPLEDRRELYHALLPLGWLDQLRYSQLEERGTPVAGALDALVKIEHAFPAGQDRPGVALLPYATGFVRTAADRFDEFGVDLIRTDAARVMFMAQRTAFDDVKAFRKAAAQDRPLEPFENEQVARSNGLYERTGFIELSARIAMLQPAYAFEVELESAGRNALVVRLAHPGTRQWYQAMDGLTEAGASSGEVLWGRITATFPAALAPRPPYRVVVHFRLPPGLTEREVSVLFDRYASIGSLTLRQLKD